ncbi:putative multidrug resistance protein norM Multidrug-efflux transporter [Proteiniborus sp. DW1]|uniref:MATE family efflux transporter n=1 Tax=Proteiniborus sp. DW1 TaxID=1889883 RepID=UPI00092E0434|nr:MATE family efflux transporter [Proteiniborus sp. DW1]SCG81648.1 putative multidrug resistance protein norM Multidrug-efflux transporter [Proteiniborus sp. DW1]
MTKTSNLTEGNILKALFRIAIPIMGTSFVQMAYNMTDMIWVGKIGSRAVAAVGTAGFFTWLAMAFILIPKIGAEVGVAQSVGKKDMDEAKVYIKHSIQMIVCLALLYAFTLITFRKPLIGFFNLGEIDIINNAIIYLVIIACGLIFYFINPVFTAIFNGYGESKTPFVINSIGLIVNMILDPVLILGIGPFPRLEVAGAAIATVIAQATVTIIFITKVRKRTELFSGLNLLTSPDMAHLSRIIKLGFPVALQSGLFTVFAMIIARIIAQWGPIPIAVQKVGSQIEAVSWMTAGGFQTAMSAFVGQNYGAKKWPRVFRGYFTGITIMSIIGILTTCLLFFAAKPLFSIFIEEEETIRYGVVYLRILAFSQLFMCIEATTAGAFNGLGKTIPPSIVGIVFNGLRIPAALILSSTSLGLNGVWWAISISSIFKGIVLATWYMIMLKRNPETKELK